MIRYVQCTGRSRRMSELPTSPAKMEVTVISDNGDPGIRLGTKT